jgi:hypothetical protein
VDGTLRMCVWFEVTCDISYERNLKEIDMTDSKTHIRRQTHPNTSDKQQNAPLRLPERCIDLTHILTSSSLLEIIHRSSRTMLDVWPWVIAIFKFPFIGRIATLTWRGLRWLGGEAGDARIFDQFVELKGIWRDLKDMA